MSRSKALTRRAVGIVRVSQVSGRDGESFISPDQQRERIEQACAQQGLNLVDTFPELNVSGGADLSRRPGLSKALKMVENGEAEVVVAAYFDRLFRSLQTQAEVTQRIEDAHGKLLALDTGTISNGSAGEWLNASMLGLVSEYYKRQAEDRSRATADRLVERGASATVPFGYRRNGIFQDGQLVTKHDTNRDAKALVIDPETSPYVEQIFQMRADRRSWAEISRWLTSEGIKPRRGGVAWPLSTLRNLIANEVYVGVLIYGNRRLEGGPKAPPAIVSRRLWKSAQSVRTVERTGKNAAGLAGGILDCAQCGAPLSVTGSNPAYTCARVRNSCERRTYVSRDRADEWLEELMIELLRDAKLDVVAESRGLEDLRQSAGTARDELEAYITSATALDVQMFSLGLDARKARLDAAESAYQAARESAHQAPLPDLDGWSALNLDGRRRVVRRIIDRIEVLPPAGKSPKLPIGDRFVVHGPGWDS